MKYIPKPHSKILTYWDFQGRSDERIDYYADSEHHLIFAWWCFWKWSGIYVMTTKKAWYCLFADSAFDNRLKSCIRILIAIAVINILCHYVCNLHLEKTENVEACIIQILVFTASCICEFAQSISYGIHNESQRQPFVQQSVSTAATIIAVQSLVGDGAVAATPLDAEPFMELLGMGHESQN